MTFENENSDNYSNLPSDEKMLARLREAAEVIAFMGAKVISPDEEPEWLVALDYSKQDNVYEAGYVRGDQARGGLRELPSAVCVFAMVRLQRQSETDLRAFENRCREWSLVREVHRLNGEIDFIIKCVVPDLREFQSFLTEDLLVADNVAKVITSLVINGKPLAVLKYGLAKDPFQLRIKSNQGKEGVDLYQKIPPE